MRSLGWALSQYNQGPYKNIFTFWTDRNTEKTGCENEGSDWGDILTSQAMPKTASNTPES